MQPLLKSSSRSKSSVVTVDASASAWADVFALAVADPGNRPVGEGWKTFAQIKSENKWGQNYSRTWLKRSLDDGLLEVFSGSEKSGDKKQALKQRWYRPVSIKNKDAN
jgi:hypothetical protein